jgi:hypothetical protein
MEMPISKTATLSTMILILATRTSMVALSLAEPTPTCHQSKGQKNDD